MTPSRGPPRHTGLDSAGFDVVSVSPGLALVRPCAGKHGTARILRPHGVLGLIWNQLDTSVPWVHRLSRIMHAGDVHKPHFKPAVGPEFIGLESHLTRWEDPVTPEDIKELTKSRSYYLAANGSHPGQGHGQPRLVPARASGACRGAKHSVSPT